MVANEEENSNAPTNQGQTAAMETLRRCPFKPIVLNNITDGNRTVDTLHKEAYATFCMAERCTGSIMYPVGGESEKKQPPGMLRPKEETKRQAVDFLKQYYASMNSEDSEEHKTRVDKVTSEIEETGTYDMDINELNFGARLAWRNAPRCIGRIQWKKLQLFDCRHVKTPREMFECILQHIKYGTNEGNLRSTITIFPHRSADMLDFRIWNAQLVKYAGYKQEDGSVIGDPGSVDLTQIAQQLGWVGKGTPFDVLPLILQANGELPELFEIPEEYIMEVKIKHPAYEKIDDLNLKWYCLPAVANMSLDCGGIEFTAAPFNGWYMATEIGARNFTDKDRYNMLKPVAKCIGLDTSNNATLWKDTAVVELTKAVLHSFNAAGVTIADHHATSESFMKHLKDEQALRGGCPADWVWIVPPMSGAATRVFHQEMLNYKLKPFYEYQTDPWKYFPITAADGKRKKKTFKGVAEAVIFTSKLFMKTLAKRNKVTILYATETGKSEEYATMLNELFLHAFDSKVICMEDYDFANIYNEKCVLIVASTFGNGEAPDNGQAFEQKLRKLVYPERIHKPLYRTMSSSSTFTETPKTDLENLKFSIFALGSRAYPQFCAFGKQLNKYIRHLGAEEMYYLGEGDELNGQEESFRIWARNCFQSACDAFCVKNAKISASSMAIWKSVADWQEGSHRIIKAEKEDKTVDLCKGLSKVHRRKVTLSKVTAVENLQSEESGRVTDFVQLNTKESDGIVYQPGDHVCVYPSNNAVMVKELLEYIKTEHDIDQPIFVQRITEDDKWVPVAVLPMPCTLRQMFTHYLDINTPPSVKFLSLLTDICKNEDEKIQLTELVKVNELYEDWKYKKYPNVLEVLKKFSSAQPDITMLISQLPILKPRFYSISSSPNLHPDEIHLTVALVNYRVDAKTEHFGVCSSWLHSLVEDDTVPCHIRPAPKFHLPEKENVPVIMIGPGTGIAPFRSFWEERVYQISKNPELKSNMHLYFGCRNSKLDNIYCAERKKAYATGVFKTSLTAFSREDNKPKVYVQDLIRANSDEILYLIIQYGGHIYVCGDVKMAASVNKALIELIEEFGAFTDEEATYIVDTMKRDGRYHEDIFGVFKHKEVTTKVREAVKRKRNASIRGSMNLGVPTFM